MNYRLQLQRGRITNLLFSTSIFDSKKMCVLQAIVFIQDLQESLNSSRATPHSHLVNGARLVAVGRCQQYHNGTKNYKKCNRQQRCVIHSSMHGRVNFGWRTSDFKSTTLWMSLHFSTWTSTAPHFIETFLKWIFQGRVDSPHDCAKIRETPASFSIIQRSGATATTEEGGKRPCHARACQRDRDPTLKAEIGMGFADA